jgi:hypothetical protein
LVTFRAKRLTRVLNVEATLLTLSLLLLSSTPYFFVYLAVLLLKPRYRAPRLWPDEARHGDYLRLSVILLALIPLFSLNNYALSPWPSFAGIVIIPLFAITTTYLVLHRTGTPRRFAIGTAVWISVTAMLVVHMLLAEIHPERFSGYVETLVRVILVLTTLGVAVMTVLMLGGWKRSGRVRDALRILQRRYGYATLYRFCGVLLIIIGVVLPVVGFFTISRHVEVELLVKYSQLRAAAGLERRIDHLVTMNALPPDAAEPTKQESYSDIFRNHLTSSSAARGISLRRRKALQDQHRSTSRIRVRMGTMRRTGRFRDGRRDGCHRCTKTPSPSVRFSQERRLTTSGTGAGRIRSETGNRTMNGR